MSCTELVATQLQTHHQAFRFINVHHPRYSTFCKNQAQTSSGVCHALLACCSPGKPLIHNNEHQMFRIYQCAPKFIFFGWYIPSPIGALIIGLPTLYTYHIYILALHYITSHYMTLHDMTLHDITLHCMTLHDITWHYMTLQYITWHYMTLHNYRHTDIHTLARFLNKMCWKSAQENKENNNHSPINLLLCGWPTPSFCWLKSRLYKTQKSSFVCVGWIPILDDWILILHV